MLEKIFENKGQFELNEYNSAFTISVRIKDANEYEPTSLGSSIAMQLRATVKKALSLPRQSTACLLEKQNFPSKQKQLKKQGKGNQHNTSVALTSEELKVMFDKGLLGMRSPEAALLNTPRLNSTLQFGLGGCKEHRDMCGEDTKRQAE